MVAQKIRVELDLFVTYAEKNFASHKSLKFIWEECIQVKTVQKISDDIINILKVKRENAM